jgi:predicted nucleotidyltransferase
MYRVLRKYFDHITDSGHFRQFGNFEEYTASQRLSSSVERGQAVLSRIVDFAETTSGVQFIGIFGSMARAALGYIPEPMPERTDADVDILLIFSRAQLGRSIEETQRAVEQLLDPEKTKVTWGPDLSPFYHYRDDNRVDVDIECLEAGSRFYVSNRLLGYSIFRYFMPLYSADRLAVASYIGIPTVPLSEGQRWAVLECDRQGLRALMERLKTPQEIPETDPRRLAAQMVRNLVWAMTGIWSPTANEAIAYLQATDDWRGLESLQRVKRLLQDDTQSVRRNAQACLADVTTLGDDMLRYGQDRKLIPAIGIGTAIADRPSHTTKHTDHVLRRFG